MDEYITNVEQILENETDSVLAIGKISDLKLSVFDDPLKLLIRGDSYELSEYIDRFEDYGDDEQEMEKRKKYLAEQLINKIHKYVGDFKGGISYSMDYYLKATYFTLLDGSSKDEYLDLIKKPQQKTNLEEILVMAGEWEKNLLERVAIYSQYPVDKIKWHKLVNVNTCYKIKDGNGSLIADGFIEFPVDDNRSFSTWLNQNY